MKRVANENINPMIAARETGGYQGYGAPNEEELLAAMSAKEANYSPTQPQSVPDSYNMDSLDRDRELLYAMQAGALDSSPTTLAGGLSRLGQAWLARGADKDITAREDEMRAAEQAKAMQAQQKRDEMIAAMVGGDEQAFAALYTEEYAKNQFEMQRDAAKQDPFVVNGRVLDPSNPQNVLADYSDPDGPDWQRTTINKDGVPTIVEYDRNAEDPQSTMRPIGSEYVKPDPDAGRPDAAGEGQFRREFNSLTKDFRAVHESYNRITATDTSTPAGQMGLIFQYMKMLDPGSTVREGEYATAQNTTGVPGQVLNAYNKAIEGEFLNKNQILDFESQAKNLYDRAAQIYGDRVKDYRRLADEYEFSPDRTVVDVRGFFEPAQGVGGHDAPPPGVDPQDWEYMTPEERALWGNG
tara:strand:- start:5012 stop:6244 length:1233 start_codon:yes stop_codon:yes gene_type:complete